MARFGKSEVVLLAAEALLLGGCDQLAVRKQGRGGVVEVAGHPENVHQLGALSPVTCRLSLL